MENELRVVGNPNGVNVMYIEDYVYSFMKKNMQEKKVEVILFGNEKTENQKHYYYVSGMTLDEEGKRFFEKANYLGMAKIMCAKDGHPFLGLVKKEAGEIIFEDYFIFFEENADMKNYMLSLRKKERKEKDEQVEVWLQRSELVVKPVSVFKYLIIICMMAYVIISMNHYCKLEILGEQMIYIIYTLSGEDTFYTP